MRSARSGLTLVEVLVAVVILSFGIVAVLVAFQQTLSALGTARDAVYAGLLLREKMAEIDLHIVEERDLPVLASEDTFPEPHTAFRWTLTEREIESGDRMSLHEIVLTVRRDGASREYTAATYVTIAKE